MSDDYVEIEPGLIVDATTGEIIECPDGGDPMLRVARRLFEAQVQERGWAMQVGAAKAALIKGQAERQSRYDDMVVTVQQNRRRVFDVEGYREFVAAEELARTDLEALALAAKDIDPSRLSESLRELVRAFEKEAMTKPFIVTRAVLKPAPGVKE